MKTTKKQPKKAPAKNLRPETGAKTRQLKKPDYRSFRLQKRIKHPGPKLVGSFKLFKQSTKLLLANKKLFLGIVLVYLVLTLVLVKGFGSGNNLPQVKSTLEGAFTGGTGKIISTVAVFSFLVGSSGSATTDAAKAYQSILLISVSLVIIWALRQVHASKKVGVRDAFYKGMYPIVPFMLVLIIISLQLLPLLAGAGLYSLVSVNGLAVTVAEQVVWILLFAMLALLSLYMITSSAFALYIVTLPDVRPLQALRSARELVRYRRWTIMRKVLFLPLALMVIGIIIMVPLIMFLTPVAEWVFFALTMVSVALVHSYMYGLYRELL